MPGVVVHTSNPSTQAGGLQVQGQPGLHGKTPSQKKKKMTKKKTFSLGASGSRRNPS
jgi:hypothetical protein